MILDLIVQIGGIMLVFALITFILLLKISKEIKEDEVFKAELMRESHPIKSIYD